MLPLGLGDSRDGTAYHVLWLLNQERYITKLPPFSPLFNIHGTGWGWQMDFSTPSEDEGGFVGLSKS